MKVKFRRLPMRIKLAVSFSGPMIVIFVLLLSVSYRIIETQYEEQIIYRRINPLNRRLISFRTICRI